MLYDDPPHRIDLYSLSTTTDPGGGVRNVYTLVQSGIKCSINTGGAFVRSQFDQSQMITTGTVAILSSKLTTPPTRGWKAIAADTGKTLLFTGGIRTGREMEGIPAFTYLDVEEWK